MNTSPNQAGSSPRQTHHQLYGSPDKRHVDPAVVPVHNGYFEAAMGLHQGSGALHKYSDSFDHYRANANDVNQYRDLDLHTNCSHHQPLPMPTSPFAAHDNQEFLRDLTNYSAQSNSGSHFGEGHSNYPSPTPFSYMAPQHSALRTGASPVSMQSSPQFSAARAASSDNAALERRTKYPSFQCRFQTSEEARDHRRRGTRFDREPYCDPNTDTSIADIEKNRLTHVMCIYNAMTSGEAAKDNRGSIAMKRWVLDAHYPPDLVEAYAHKVFDCLLLQAKEGFRGWVHNDYVADERKGDDIDKDVDCAGRLGNIILALEQEKTICEDVMNSACQIRMFVNAPRAYANRKHQNRVGNSKRGRAKDTPDPNPKGSKMARTNGKRTRACSKSSRDTTPHTLQPLQRTSAAAPPYYSSPASQQLSPSPMVSGYAAAAPRLTPLYRTTMSANRNSFGHHSMPAVSLPTSSPRLIHAPQAHVPCMTTEPPQLQSPFKSPPQPVTYEYSAPASPREAKSVLTDAGFDSRYGIELQRPTWMQEGVAIDPVLSQWDYFPGEELANSTLSHNETGKFVNLSEIEGGRSQCYLGCSSSSADMCRRDHGLQD